LQTNDKLASKNSVKFLNKVKKDKNSPFALFISYLNPHQIYAFPARQYLKGNKDISLPKSWYEEKFHDKPPCQEEFMKYNQGKVIYNKPIEKWKIYHQWYKNRNKQFDNHVGKIIEKLKDIGEYENTIIIITSDHGDMDTNHKLIYKGPCMYEHLMRVPLIFRIPKKFGGISPRNIKNIHTTNVDLVPTILDLCNLPDIICDGISLKPTLIGNKQESKHEFIIGQYYGKQSWVNPIRTIRTSKYKFSIYISQGEELYDLEKDPDELNNLANQTEYSQIKKKLIEDLDNWIENNNDPFYSQEKNDKF